MIVIMSCTIKYFFDKEISFPDTIESMQPVELSNQLYYINRDNNI